MNFLLKCILVVTLFFLSSATQAASNGGNAGNGGSGGVLTAPAVPAVPDDELRKFEASLSPEQITALKDNQAALLNLHKAQGVENRFDASRDWREKLCHLYVKTEKERIDFFLQLNDSTDYMSRSHDPLYISKAEREAAGRLPPQAKVEVEKIATGTTTEVIAARQHVLAYGESCRALALDRARSAKSDSWERIKLHQLLDDLKLMSEVPKLLPVLEGPERRARDLDHSDPSRIHAVLLDMRFNAWMSDRDSPLSEFTYYSFHHKKRTSNDSSLRYGNGVRHLDVCNYTGQNSEIVDLGAHAKLPATWTDALKAVGKAKGDTNVLAVAGHSYAECWREPRLKVELFVVFEVMEATDDAVIISWKPGN
jgi:hypothetical protein